LALRVVVIFIGCTARKFQKSSGHIARALKKPEATWASVIKMVARRKRHRAGLE
jgi:hypothetical protein